MRTNVITLFFAIFISGSCFGQFHFGAGAQFQFEGTIFGLQGKAFYEYDNTWRGSGTFTIHLDEFANFSIDLDAHYKLLDVGENFNLAPLGGLTIANYEIVGTEIGLNLGAFIDLDFSGKHVYIEPKFIFINGGSGLVVSGGIFF